MPARIGFPLEVFLLPPRKERGLVFRFLGVGDLTGGHSTSPIDAAFCREVSWGAWEVSLLAAWGDPLV
jgi:hypothetical protein